MNIREIGVKYKDYMIEMRRHFHQNPEPSLHEFETSKRIKEELDKLNIPYESVAGTGVIATITGGKPGKTVMLRADIDALEVQEENDVEYKSCRDGVMHACGHDGHASSLLGAAHILNEVKDELNGNVKLVFQPAEEIAAGAKKVMEESNLAEVCDACFGIHLWADIPAGKINIEPGPRMASAGIFSIDIKGKSGHGSAPHQTVDAVVVGSAIIMNLQTVVSRMTDPLDTLVVTVGKFDAGTRFNVISGSARLDGTTRCFTKEVLEKSPKEIEKMARLTAEAYGATIEFSHYDATIPVINDPEITEIVANSAEKLYGNESLVSFEKITGGEDFSYFMEGIPGAFGFVGIGNSEKGANFPHHHEKFNMDEDALEVAANLYAQFAVDFLNDN
ncbi:MAG: amidohydrolase [Tissierellia bacterium]|nr:amidohydrolase [Tissierellia bacterium]